VNARPFGRTTLTVLWILLLDIYIAAKIHFFARYDSLHTADFVRAHRVFWLAMAATAFLIWLVEQFRRNPH
jgi:hypothetical protein